MDAFDAGVLIYAAVPGHPLGRRVAALFRFGGVGALAGAGSVLLLPEVLGKPLRDGCADEVRALAGLLARLDLRPVDRATAELATALSSLALASSSRHRQPAASQHRPLGIRNGVLHGSRRPAAG
ncbi:MAG: hypothetical protein ABR926_19530 [Streptosporangiaceae bacterium]|jgi:hypothetical protein